MTAEDDQGSAWVPGPTPIPGAARCPSASVAPFPSCGFRSPQKGAAQAGLGLPSG